MANFFKGLAKVREARKLAEKRKDNRTPREVKTTKTGGSAFDSAANLKSSTRQSGASSSRTPTEIAAVKARRMKAKKDALAEKRSLANIKKIAKEKAEALKKAAAKKAKDTGKKIDSALTSKKLKAEKAALAANKRKSAKKEKKDQKNPFADTKKGTKLFKDATGAKFKKERLARLNRNKKAGDKLDDKIKKSVGTKKKIIGGTAAGITGIGGAVALSGSGDKKSTTPTPTAAQTAAQRKAASEKRKTESRKAFTDAGRRAATTKTSLSEKKKTTPDLSLNKSKRATVTGRDDSKGARNVGKGKTLKANVTREQLSKLGLDPSKKSSLTTYLNAYDKLGRRPTKKSDITAKKNMGGMMMKKKGYSKGGAMKKKGYAMGGMAKKGYSKGGAMKKKGYAMGGMTKKGYANGGDVGSLDGLSEKQLKQMIRRLKLKQSLKKPKNLSKGPSASSPDRMKISKKPRSRREQAAELMNLPAAQNTSPIIGRSTGAKKKSRQPRVMVNKNMGGMMKKKGYSSGGSMKKKGFSNGGLATRGYGAIMKK